MYSQIADVSYKRLTRTFTVPAAGGNLSFWTSYNTEADWDHLFVEVHTVGPERLDDAARRERPHDAGDRRELQGENSGGWRTLHPFLDHYQTQIGDDDLQPDRHDRRVERGVGRLGRLAAVAGNLAAYAGKQVEVSISYASDWATQGLGVFVDDVTLPDGSSTSFESGLDGWTVPGSRPAAAPNANDFDADRRRRLPGGRSRRHGRLPVHGLRLRGHLDSREPQRGHGPRDGLPPAVVVSFAGGGPLAGPPPGRTPSLVRDKPLASENRRSSVGPWRPTTLRRRRHNRPRRAGRHPPSRFDRGTGRAAVGSSSSSPLLALNFFISSRAMEPASRVRVPYSPFFLQQVKAGNVAEITSKGTAIQGTFSRSDELQGRRRRRRASGRRSRRSPTRTRSRSCCSRTTSSSTPSRSTPASPWWQNLLLGFGPTILFVFLLFWLMRRAGNVQNVLGSFGRSRARRYEPSGDKVTFADVAGIDEAKEELTRGRRLPAQPGQVPPARRPDPARRAPLGPPGTGKTLLARAVAGEANVPFFSMAASEFVEAIVGVGAVTRARPVQGGEGGRAGDRLHRRARRDRPLAHVRHRAASAAATTSASRR